MFNFKSNQEKMATTL